MVFFFNNFTQYTAQNYCDTIPPRQHKKQGNKKTGRTIIGPAGYIFQ